MQFGGLRSISVLVCPRREAWLFRQSRQHALRLWRAKVAQDTKVRGSALSPQTALEGAAVRPGLPHWSTSRMKVACPPWSFKERSLKAVKVQIIAGDRSSRARDLPDSSGSWAELMGAGLGV